MERIGTLIKEKLKEQGKSQKWLAQKLSTSDRNFSDMLKREDLYASDLKIISEALAFDFFQYYRPSINTDSQQSMIKRKKQDTEVSIEIKINDPDKEQRILRLIFGDSLAKQFKHALT